MVQFFRSHVIHKLTLGMAFTWLIAACGGPSETNSVDSGTEPVTLTVATEPTFPPFESQSSTGELEGFDIDLMNAIAEAAALVVEYESLPFDGIIPGLQNGTVDAAISAITITEERLETVDFSRPYFKAGLAIAVAIDDNSVQTLADLEGKTIAVQIGTTGANKALTVQDAEVSIFDSIIFALQELANGNVDAVINDAPVTLEAIARGELNTIQVVEQLLTEEFYGIALPQGSEHLDGINTGLSEVLTNGIYAEIYQKWFGTEPPELPEAAF